MDHALFSDADAAFFFFLLVPALVFRHRRGKRRESDICASSLRPGSRSKASLLPSRSHAGTTSVSGICLWNEKLDEQTGTVEDRICV